MTNQQIPPELNHLSRAGRGCLRAVAIRLDPQTLEEVDQLASKLHNPTRAALLRHLVLAGLQATRERLESFGDGQAPTS